MLDLSYILFWYRKLVLAPLGLSAAVRLHHDAEAVKIGKEDEEGRQTLYELLRNQCPSLVGHRAWYSPSFWLCHSGHFQVCVFA